MRKMLGLGLAVLIGILSSQPASAEVKWLRYGPFVTATAATTITTGQVLYEKSNAQVALADADVGTRLPVAGLAYNSISTGGTVGIVTWGLLSGQTSITSGKAVYLSTTPGTITSTAPLAYPKKLGYAKSATTYMIEPEPGHQLKCMTLEFTDNNLATGQAGVAMHRAGSATVTEIEMPWAGSVIGVAVVTNEARTAGLFTVDPTINGTVIGLQCNLDATNTIHHAVRQNKLTDQFAAGDRIGVKYTTTGEPNSWAPVTADFSVMVFIESGGEL